MASLTFGSTDPFLNHPENLMDTLHAAYWVCVAVHVAFWLYARFKGP